MLSFSLSLYIFSFYDHSVIALTFALSLSFFIYVFYLKSFIEIETKM